MTPNNPDPPYPGEPVPPEQATPDNGPGGVDSDPTSPGIRLCRKCKIPIPRYKNVQLCGACKPKRFGKVKTYATKVVTRHPSKAVGGFKTKDQGVPTGPKKHVKLDLLVNEHPAHDRGATDGVDTPRVVIEYNPHPKQDIFSEAIEKGAKIIFFLAGIRSGKTVSGAYEVLKHIYKYDRTPNLFFMVSPTNAMTRTPIRIFQNASGDALVHYKRASDQGPAHFLMRPSPSIPEYYYVVEHHSGEHPDRMRGPTISGAWLDECQHMKSEVLDIVKGRVMESGGVIFMTGTPSFPGHWTKTEVVDRAYRCGRCGVCVYDHYDLVDPDRRLYGPKDHEPVDCTGDPRIAVITCSTFDNTFIPKAQIEELRADYSLKDPIIARRELYAEYAGFEGLVYSHFDRTSHASEYTTETVPRDAYVCAGIDFGVNDPFVCTFLAKVRDAWHVIGEYYTEEKGISLKEHAQRIKNAAGPIWPRIKKFWHDPSGRIAAMELNRYGLRPMVSARKRHTSGQNWKTYRYEVLTSHMMGKDEKNRPLFRISPVCKRTVNDFESRKWKRYMSKGEDGSVRVIDLRGHEVDRNAGDDFAPGFDHGTDAVEYALCSEFVKGLYKVKNTRHVDGDVVTLDEREKVQISPEAANLSRYLGVSLEEKRKKLMSGKFRIDRFQTGY